MNFLRLHWFDIGLAFAFVTGGIVFTSHLNTISLLLWISLISLFLHQFEEYRYPGYLLYEQFNIGSFGYLAWIATFILAVLINAAIENFVLRRVFKLEKAKAGFRWLCLANAPSVGVAFASFWFFPIRNF